MLLWHILYSVEDKIEIGKALKKFAEKNDLPDSFAEVFGKIKPFKKDYGSYSEKAIKKLLPLMCMGKYWDADGIDAKTKERIDKILTGECDKNIKNRVREKAINLSDISHFKGLPVWLACYIVYDRHSEAKEISKWKKPEDIDIYLKDFKQHSLRNPIVEQVITETLRSVRDIWKQEGQIDEIHLELGREMKNPADKRKKMTERILENENTNLRIKALLMEFMNDPEIENVRPYSPSQQDILRIYEENALDNLTKEDKDFDFVSKISKTAQPSKADIIRYKCWLEQKYRSPYTGEMIPLAKLFTSAYEIEHIIPQSSYFDDSFSNKVICEAEVNKLKDRLLGYEFIKAHHGEKVQLSQSKTVEILSVEAYEKFVKDHYSTNRTKMKKLLMDDIPDGFIERQLNDSRYISKVVKGLLSNIVREKLENGEYEQEAVSKNLISCNGSITDRLKKDWGMNDVWNSIILPRFQRLNELTGNECFTTTSAEGHLIPQMPLELQKGFNKKRIDHRHHAMDAIVIACATRDHVNLLNNEAAHSKHNANRYQLQRKLRRFEKMEIDGKEHEIAKEFLKPWDSFTTDAKQALENIIVSFKQNLRVINKTTNFYQHYDETGKKVLVPQKKGDNWAVRKSMHKDTVFGEVNLRKVKAVSLVEALKKPERIVNKEFKQKVRELLAEGRDAKFIKKYLEENKDIWSDVNVSKIDVYYFTKETNERFFATRKPLDTSFDKKKIEDSVTDTGIQKILLAHLTAKGGNPELAFSPDGIDEMNRNIVALNNGKFHQPILKVRVYEKADKFAVGQKGNKASKFVEAAKGTNLFFAIFVSEKLNKETGEMDSVRSYCTIPLNVMIDCQKKYGSQWQNNIESFLKEKEFVANDAKLLFILSPNDLVYLPTKEEKRNGILEIDRKRIYKFIDPNSNKGNFIPYSTANVIFSVNFTDQKKRGISYSIQDEFGIGSQCSKNPRAITGEMIKETCIPIKVDRLGNIIELNGKRL
jgi:CRISPR-associated endonuclease Csn1